MLYLQNKGSLVEKGLVGERIIGECWSGGTRLQLDRGRPVIIVLYGEWEELGMTKNMAKIYRMKNQKKNTTLNGITLSGVLQVVIEFPLVYNLVNA